MNWLNRFMVFLVVLVFAISVGVSIYYFSRNNEVYAIDTNYVYLNIGEDVILTLTHENARASSEFALTSVNEDVVSFINKPTDNSYRFRAKAGGSTSITLTTNNAKYQEIACEVRVGDGTASAPFYVRNAEDLSYIGITFEEDSLKYRSLSATYVQTADIDLSGYPLWTPIGQGSAVGFSGSYFANGHSISNINLDVNAYNTVNTTETKTFENIGIFSQISSTAVISNLKIQNCNVNSSSDNAGALAGINAGKVFQVSVDNSNIINTKATGNAGGILGKLVSTATQYNGKLTSSSFTNGKVIGNKNLGGLVGESSSGLVTNCFAHSTTIQNEINSCNAGGLVGLNSANIVNSVKLKSSITNCYSVVTFDCTSPYGAILGKNVNADNSSEYAKNNPNCNRIYGNYYLTADSLRGVAGESDNATDYMISGVNEEALSIIPTATQLESLQSATKSSTVAFITYSSRTEKLLTWDFENLWTVNASKNLGYPFIKENAIEIIDNVNDPETPEYPNPDATGLEQLNYCKALDVADDGILNGSIKYIISNDIILSSSWTPLGNLANPFNGVVEFVANGDGILPKIYNLVIDGEFDYAGFFGVLGNNAQISDMQIFGVKITSGQYVGAIAGYNMGGVINNCNVYNNTDTATYSGITRTATSNLFVGGHVGLNAGVITNSNNGISINITQNGNSALVGGISGKNEGTINNTKFSGNILTQSTTDCEIIAGGIVGVNTNVINYSLSTASITVPLSLGQYYAGGIVGQVVGNSATINCGATTGTVTGYIAGGIVGSVNGANSDNVLVKQSYSQVNIFGGTIGGFAGRCVVGIIENCATTSHLSGTVMGGYAGTVEIASPSIYGTIKYCFSGATFELSAGRAYFETSSEVRKLTYFWDNNTKEGGYISNCAYDREAGNGAERRIDSFSYFVNFTADGSYSTAECKNLSTYTSIGFSIALWNCLEGEYPTIVSARYI